MKKRLFSIELSKQAEIDFDESYKFYYDESPKVANKFLIAIDNNLEKIKENPFSFPIIFKDLRKTVLKKFPHVIYFQIDDNIIKIIAIFHSSRNPKIWESRK